jgi:hypothetical protein
LERGEQKRGGERLKRKERQRREKDREREREIKRERVRERDGKSQRWGGDHTCVRILVEILLPRGDGFRTSRAKVGAAASDALLCLHSVPETATKRILLPLVVSFLVGTTS